MKIKYRKIANLLGSTIDKVPKCSNKKEIYDKYDIKYNTSKQIKFKTSMVRSNLYDYFDAYIIVKEKITLTGPNDNAYDKELAFERAIY